MITNQIKLSLIIPIYGVEKYIGLLLESLLPQLNDQVECIFINDGTKDNSFNILKEYLIKYPNNNYQLLEQTNQGIAKTRNNGMKLANGEYFGFIDSDDEVEENYIKEILNVINHNEFDIMHFNATKIEKNNTTKDIVLADEYGLHTITDDYKIKIFKEWYPWLRVFHKKYITKLYFPENMIFEDALAIPNCYEYANVIYELPLQLIRYHYRPSSLINRKNLLEKYRSALYGIDKFTYKINKKEYFITFNFFAYTARNLAMQISFKTYCDFIKKHQTDVLKLLKTNNSLSPKKRFFIKHPYLFYFVKKNYFIFKF